LLLDFYVQSLDTGEVLRNSFDGLPRAFILAPELLGTDLYNVLLTARVGTRVLSVAPSENAFADEPSIVIVIDVLADTAVGEELPAKEALPVVKAEPGAEPEVFLTEGDPLPVDLSVSTLILGQGEQIVPGSFIIAQFTSVYTVDGTKGEKTWKVGDIRQTTWPPEQAPFEGQVGKGKLLRAWDEGLIDQTAGSRVMLVVPEEWGYPGEGTIIYVIDILDVWNPES
jgi:peptidylprolyl isomerase